MVLVLVVILVVMSAMVTAMAVTGSPNSIKRSRQAWLRARRSSPSSLNASTRCVDGDGDGDVVEYNQPAFKYIM